VPPLLDDVEAPPPDPPAELVEPLVVPLLVEEPPPAPPPLVVVVSVGVAPDSGSASLPVAHAATSVEQNRPSKIRER
jgi:hypothetical protein